MPLALVAEHVRLEAPRHAQVAAPGMGDLHVLELREQFAEQIAAQLDFAAGQVEVMAQLAGKLVTAAGAEDQAVVRRALAVSDLAAAFAERLAVAQADLVPGRGGQRLGGDDQALHRQLITPQRRQGDRITFDRRHHPAAAHRGLGRAQAARLPMGDRAVFVDPHAHALHRPRQAAHQFGRVDGRDVRCIDTAIRLGDADLLRQLLAG